MIKKTANVMMSCAKAVGMSKATAKSWDPGLWLYPLMGVHEDMQGTISQEDILEDEEGSFYFTEFDCGCSFYVPSTSLKGTYNDGLPGDVDLEEPTVHQN
jgi:hypothetical protein